MLAAAVCLLAALLVHAIVKGRKPDILRLCGSVLVAGGILLFHLPLAAPAPLISHFMLLTGLILCSLAMYRNTYADLHELVASHETKLRRLDANLQHEVIRRVASIEKSNRVLLEKARTDNLTGLFSKAAVVSHAEDLMRRHPQVQMSLIMLDIDFFKGLNDKLGHQVGDQCLKSLAGIARASFRGNDILGRYGGDEFIFLLPGTPPIMALTVAERFRRNVEVGSNPKFTVSVGIATYPQDGRTVREIIDASRSGALSFQGKGTKPGQSSLGGGIPLRQGMSHFRPSRLTIDTCRHPRSGINTRNHEVRLPAFRSPPLPRLADPMKTCLLKPFCDRIS